MKYVANPVEVEGRRIVGVLEAGEKGNNLFELEDGTEFFADDDMISRFPHAGPGDYVVTQADGYYLNPADVFERKYRTVEDDDGANDSPLLTDEQLSSALASRPGARVTKELIDERIYAVQYIVPAGTTMTICIIELKNRFTVRGESACVDPKNFDKDIGQRYAYDDAYRKLWPLFGFLLAEDQWRAREGRFAENQRQ